MSPRSMIDLAAFVNTRNASQRQRGERIANAIVAMTVGLLLTMGAVHMVFA